ncbi:LytR family transcriptional regulator [Streptococcus devriesei]|uniref:LytR family transcriptional regulator n=1 Tax=Streptococcus devriesei TaxID=231233 RepID=UPI0003FAFC29|nr:LytR family transcriptional regulator [Streptococcus devriesei]
MTEKETLDILLNVYAYHHAYQIVKVSREFSDDIHFLLELLKERRELNVDFLFQHRARLKELESAYQISLLDNAYEEELLANYIMDLEAKLRNDNIIDFVRSVSPILYRLFMRLLNSQIPDIEDYIYDAKNDQYDVWEFDKMHQSSNPFVQDFVAKRRDSKVTSKSLVDFIQLTDLPENIKAAVLLLRDFEKSARNPLAHLIKPFDEEELHRTTGFSSKTFLEKIIALAIFSGVIYDSKTFYFDKVNDLIKNLY